MFTEEKEEKLCSNWSCIWMSQADIDLRNYWMTLMVCVHSLKGRNSFWSHHRMTLMVSVYSLKSHSSFWSHQHNPYNHSKAYPTTWSRYSFGSGTGKLHLRKTQELMVPRWLMAVQPLVARHLAWQSATSNIWSLIYGHWLVHVFLLAAENLPEPWLLPVGWLGTPLSGDVVRL